MTMNRVPLLDLGARWAPVEGRPSDDCLLFRCPSCRGKASHLVLVATQQPALSPGGGVWKVDGSRDLERVTLTPTINLTVPVELADGTQAESRCRFHGRIRGGAVEWSDETARRRRSWLGVSPRASTVPAPEA